MSAMPITRAGTLICSRVSPLRIALAVHALVVAAGVFRHLRQVRGPGQRLEHADGHHDVVVDDLALGVGQRAAADGQVLDLVRRQEGLHAAVGAADLALRQRLDRRHGGIVHELAAGVRLAHQRAVGLDRGHRRGVPASSISPRRRAISASRSSSSKRRSSSSMRSNMVCSLVALSTTCTGVVILPQSCSRPAIFSS
jgi:hypothetical protein